MGGMKAAAAPTLLIHPPRDPAGEIEFCPSSIFLSSSYILGITQLFSSQLPSMACANTRENI